MSDNRMWFGNRNYMQWIACPEAGADYGLVGSQQSSEYLNGGSFQRNSMNKTKTHNLTWALHDRDSVRSVTDYAEGVFGKGAIYWGDPFTMDKNMLTQSFATPSLGGYDAPVLSGSEVRPQLIATPFNVLGYPTESAIYALNATTDVPLKHWIPIPPGYTAWIGVHGQAGTGGKVLVTPTKGYVATATAIEATILGVTDTTRVIDTVDWDANTNGVELSLGGTGTITLSGIMVQVLPTGRTPAVGGYISGQGHSGCDWSTLPAREMYSAAMDLVGLSASFVETEQWK